MSCDEEDRLETIYHSSLSRLTIEVDRISSGEDSRRKDIVMMLRELSPDLQALHQWNPVLEGTCAI